MGSLGNWEWRCDEASTSPEQFDSSCAGKETQHPQHNRSSRTFKFNSEGLDFYFVVPPIEKEHQAKRGISSTREDNDCGPVLLEDFMKQPVIVCDGQINDETEMEQ